MDEWVDEWMNGWMDIDVCQKYLRYQTQHGISMVEMCTFDLLILSAFFTIDVQQRQEIVHIYTCPLNSHYLIYSLVLLILYFNTFLMGVFNTYLCHTTRK